jgi:hypothetical protein
MARFFQGEIAFPLGLMPFNEMQYWQAFDDATLQTGTTSNGRV